MNSKITTPADLPDARASYYFQECSISSAELLELLKFVIKKIQTFHLFALSYSGMYNQNFQTLPVDSNEFQLLHKRILESYTAWIFTDTFELRISWDGSEFHVEWWASTEIHLGLLGLINSSSKLSAIGFPNAHISRTVPESPNVVITSSLHHIGSDRNPRSFYKREFQTFHSLDQQIVFEKTLKIIPPK